MLSLFDAKVHIIFYMAKKKSKNFGRYAFYMYLCRRNSVRSFYE